MKSEQAVKEIFGERPYAMLVESIRDFVIFFTDPQGDVVSWNEGARLIFGYEHSEIVGRSSFLLFTPADRESGVPEEELRKAAADGRAEDVRWHVRKDGTRLWANGVTMAMYDSTGAVLGYAKVAKDDTSRKVAEEEREHLVLSLETERARFAAIFAKAPAFVADSKLASRMKAAR